MRNYRKFGAKWLPATVVKQTGPVSYKCQLGDGRVFRRCQDQLKVRGESLARHSEPLTPDAEDFLALSTAPSDTQLVPVPVDTPMVPPETPPAIAVPASPSASPSGPLQQRTPMTLPSGQSPTKLIGGTFPGRTSAKSNKPATYSMRR